MKRLLEISLIFLALLALAGCAAQSVQMREVKLACDMPLNLADIGAPYKIQVYYGEKSRYTWWDERCSDADNILTQMEHAQRNGLDLKFSDEEWRLTSCPEPYEFTAPFVVPSAGSTEVILRLMRGKKYYAAARYLGEDRMWSSLTKEIEIPAQ